MVNKINFMSTKQTMRLELNEHIADPAGVQISDGTAAQLLAKSMLVAGSKTEEDVLKFYDWGFALAKDGAIEIDTADRERIRRFVVEQTQLSNIVKGYLLKKIIDLR